MDFTVDVHTPASVRRETHKVGSNTVNVGTRGTQTQHLSLSHYLRDENKNGVVFLLYSCCARASYHGLSALLGSVCALRVKR